MSDTVRSAEACLTVLKTLECMKHPLHKTGANCMLDQAHGVMCHVACVESKASEVS